MNQGSVTLITPKEGSLLTFVLILLTISATPVLALTATLPGDVPQIAPAPSQGCRIESPPNGAPELVATDRGVVRGAVTGRSYVFKGIPYAAPPIGDWRWKAPQTMPCWAGVRDALAFAHVCAQPGARPGTKTTWFGSEDCLYLNVWTPRDRQREERLPVLFFLHGGGNTRGAGSETVATTIPTLGPNVQDGQALAEKHRAIVVTINYRLGMLGFLAHAALSHESETRASGNYGLMDQIAALEWVQRNIAQFGGDPARVLAVGQSAGGRNVCGLLAAQSRRRWFTRAAILSGSCENFPSLERAEAVGQSWATRLGCGTAEQASACLRGLSTEQTLVAIDEPRRLFANNNFQVGPIVDGVLLKDQPVALLRSPQATLVPLLISSAGNEVAFSLFPLMFTGRIDTAEDFENGLQSLAPASIVSAIQRLYPVTEFASPRHAMTAVLTDANLVCPARRTARLVVASGGTVWRAVWTHTISNGPARAFGAAHVMDLSFWFNTLDQMPEFVPNSREVVLAGAMSRSLVAFAAAGDPNHSDVMIWPRYERATDPHLAFDDDITVGKSFHARTCDFWDANLLPPGYSGAPKRQ